MIKNEGGYILTKVKGDRGGLTYAGISRKYHPNWSGWKLVDDKALKSPKLHRRVQSFYKKQFWDGIKGDQIKSQEVANTIFDFSVNAGQKVSSKLAQKVVGVKPDGVIGPKSLAKINKADPDDFKLRFAMAKVERYAQIVNRDKSQKKFLLGWINRTLDDLA